MFVSIFHVYGGVCNIWCSTTNFFLSKEILQDERRWEVFRLRVDLPYLAGTGTSGFFSFLAVPRLHLWFGEDLYTSFLFFYFVSFLSRIQSIRVYSSSAVIFGSLSLVGGQIPHSRIFTCHRSPALPLLFVFLFLFCLLLTVFVALHFSLKFCADMRIRACPRVYVQD